MKARHFLDTNILLYSISSDPAEAAKRECARLLMDRDDGALSIQVLQEFYVQATRSTRIDPLPHEIAVGLIGLGRALPCRRSRSPSSTLLWRSRPPMAFRIGIAPSPPRLAQLECGELYSEDMSHGREIEGILIVNPFRSNFSH